MGQTFKTAGEYLVFYINEKLLPQGMSNYLETSFSFTGRATELTAFFQEVAAVNMAGRIVITGNSLAKINHIEDPVFTSAFKDFLSSSFSIPYRISEEFYRFSLRAVRASKESISRSTRSKIKNYTQSRDNKCYMCGVSLEHNLDCCNMFTCEHIWPREYGGDSDEENLLPACKSCNSSKKENFATWAMPSIQSLIHGINPTPENLQKINGSHKFAIHYRYAQQLAKHKKISLKEAFIRIGPWEDIEVIRIDDSADFFNLKNHKNKPAYSYLP